ncbi:hypothetical protein ABIA30_001809 [Mycobacterium sp. MAA66]|uniref:hypothetical protein n=1 Tax=Mycobacterium sp. MAA66 TaxID=3156297 RepID=UPI0035155339
MTQRTMMAAPAPPSPAEPEVLATSLGAADPTGVIALIAEVDAIFCVPAEAPLRQRPAPPAVGCALRGPRHAGRSYHRASPRPHGEQVQRVDPMQRSPPTVRSDPHRNPMAP